ncbi:MAG TPA: dihydrolipoyl dehydrogenase [Armatimonadetes bacterium]|nr:dihydrolipoyl dehydrogenase [Armatimonadota bacterium]
MDKFDVLVVGGGPGGYVAAIRAAQLGQKVALVDDNAALGGTCLRVGCIPSKVLLESSEQYVRATRGMAVHGVVVGDVSFDVSVLQKRRAKTVTILTKGIASLMRKNKVTTLSGRGRLAGPGQVTVTAADGSETTYAADNFILATGSVSAQLPGVEVDGKVVLTSSEALELSEVPKRLVVIGAGAIGLELGSVWQRLGAEVTVLEYLDRILPGMDAQIAGEAQKLFAKQGLAFEVGARVTGVSVAKGVAKVEVEGREPIECDRVLVAVGRRPASADLGLDTVGLEVDARGRVPVDEQCRTGVNGLWAIGDLVRGPMLAHKASDEGVAVAELIATGYGHVDYDLIPAVCYTTPEVAGVGQTEESLKEAGVPYRVGAFPFIASGRARSLDATDGQVKILAHAETDRILGVHILGPQAGELIAEATVAMAFGASSEDLARVCHAHPTLAEAVHEAALAVDGRALHI